MDHRWCRIRADLNAVVNNLLGLAKTHGEFWAFEGKTLNAEPSPKVRDGVDTNRDWLKNAQMSALSPRAYRRSIAGVLSIIWMSADRLFPANSFDCLSPMQKNMQVPDPKIMRLSIELCYTTANKPSV
jgi:hypothetical protein